MVLGACDGKRPSCTVSNYDDMHGYQVKINDEQTCIQHAGAWGQSLLRNLLEKMNWPKAQTHLAASFVMMSMWFVHHLVFLVPQNAHQHNGQMNLPIGDDHLGGDLAVDPPNIYDSMNSFTVGDDEGADWATPDSLQATHAVEPIGDDESESVTLSIANMASMILVALVPYCVNSTVIWKGLPHASTFPVFCLGVVVAMYATTMFIVLHCVRALEDNKTEARRSLLLLYVTAFVLMALASLTSGGWSIDIIIFVSPLPTLFHTQLLSLWSNLRDRDSGVCVFN